MKSNDELDLLVDSSVKQAEKLLSKYSEFYPFGVVITTRGEIAYHAIDDRSGLPSSNAILDTLRMAIAKSAEAGELNGAATVSDVRIAEPMQTNKTNAIAIDVEHVCGRSSSIYFPYSIVEGVVEIDSPFAVRKRRELLSKELDH
jgi:hypothetical protein